MFIPNSSNPHPALDQIPEQNFPNPLSREREAKFQKELNRVAGFSLNGKPNLRLLWPADPDESLSMEMVPNRDGVLVKRARYRLFTDRYRRETTSASGIVGVEDIDVDVCFNRYVIEQYHLPSEEEQGNFKAGSQGEGFYSHLFSVAHHDEHCCGGTEGYKGELCLGLYREPGTADIYNVQRMIKARDEMAHGHRPGEQASEAEVMAEARYLRDINERSIEKRREGYYEAALSGFMPHRKRLFSTDPSVVSSGGYHWMSGHNKSGTPAKQRKSE